MFRSRLLLLLCPLLLLTMAFRQTALIDPPPIPVPAGVTAAQAGKASQSALIGRGWTVTHEQPGGIDATLIGHKYTAMIHVAYNASDVRIKYVDSTHLKYEVKKDGERMIHKNYMGWMHFLQQDIGRNLQLISATSNG